MSSLILLARSLSGRPDFMVLIFCKLVLGLAYSFTMPFMSLFGTQEVGMTPWTFGLFMTLSALSAIILTTYLAKWSDTRYSRKTMVLIGCLCGGSGYLAYAWIRDVRLLFLISAFIMGISSITFSQLFAYARNLVDQSDIPPREIPLYINVFRLCYAMSWTIGPALAAWVMQEHSFRGTFLVAASLFALLSVVVAFRVPSSPPTQKSREAASAMPLWKAFRLPGLFPHFLAFALFFSCSTMGMMNLSLLIINTLQGTGRHVGTAYSLAPIFEIPFMLYLGFLATRMESSRIIRGALILAILYYACLSLVQSPWQVYPLQILSAAVVAVTSGLAITFFQDYLPHQAGTATNLYSNAMRVGSTLGYLVFGYLSSTLGHRSVFAVCAGFCCISLLVMYIWNPARGTAAVVQGNLLRTENV